MVLCDNGRSREELAQREKLISEYGFSVISEFDEEGNLIKTNDKVRAASNRMAVSFSCLRCSTGASS